MQKAIELSIDNVNNNGGPFGAVIADKAGNILATGVNRVTSNNDPYRTRRSKRHPPSGSQSGHIRP